MKAKFENIRTKLSEFFKDDKARIGGVCVCALVLCGGIGAGVFAYANSQGSNLPSKALENTVNEDTKAESENAEKSAENGENNATGDSNDVTVNENGEVVDGQGNVVAESVEQYNATAQAQSKPVNTATPNNNASQAQPSAQPAHTHSWASRCIQEGWDEPLFEQRQVGSYSVCNYCHQRIADWDTDHEYNHIMNGITKVSTHVEPEYATIQVGSRYHNPVYQEYCTTCGTTR